MLAFGGVLLAAAGSVPISQDEARAEVGVLSGEAQVLGATWNGRPVAFVDWQTDDAEGYAQREVAVVWRSTSGALAHAAVTAGEQAGGVPELAAIGFANADLDAQRELIVILKWPQVHYYVGGNLYEVRLFDDLQPGQSTLIALERLSKHFGSECDCDWRDGTHKRYRFKTIAAVRRELRRLGY